MNLNMISFEKRKTHLELEYFGVFNSSSFLEGPNLSTIWTLSSLPRNLKRCVCFIGMISPNKKWLMSESDESTEKLGWLHRYTLEI